MGITKRDKEYYNIRSKQYYRENREFCLLQQKNRRRARQIFTDKVNLPKLPSRYDFNILRSKCFKCCGSIYCKKHKILEKTIEEYKKHREDVE